MTTTGKNRVTLDTSMRRTASLRHLIVADAEIDAHAGPPLLRRIVILIQRAIRTVRATDQPRLAADRPPSPGSPAQLR